MADKKEEPKKSESAPASENAEVKSWIQEAVASAVVAGLQVARAAQEQPRSTGKHLQAAKVTCPTCQQPKMACGGKHVKMAVYPKDNNLGRWFQGVWLNGVKYLSINGSHQIDIPEANDFARIIQQFEHAEGRLRSGSNNIRENGGSLNNYRPYNPSTY